MERPYFLWSANSKEDDLKRLRQLTEILNRYIKEKEKAIDATVEVYNYFDKGYDLR